MKFHCEFTVATPPSIETLLLSTTSGHKHPGCNINVDTVENSDTHSVKWRRASAPSTVRPLERK